MKAFGPKAFAWVHELLGGLSVMFQLSVQLASLANQIKRFNDWFGCFMSRETQHLQVDLTVGSSSMTAPIELVLQRLEKVRRRQPGQWSARCPAHGDRTPSLSVREAPSGAVLMNCFAGCSIESIADSLDLQLMDLFPPRERGGREPQRIARVLTAQQALEILDAEITFAAVATSNMARGLTLTESDHQRLISCAARIGAIAREVKA